MKIALRSLPRLRLSPRRWSRHHSVELSRHVCRRHAAPLLAMAHLILQDGDAACDVVVDTIVAACRRQQIDPRRARTALAASVYRRCLGALAARERFGPSPDLAAGLEGTVPDGPFAQLTVPQRCTMALTLFGRHSLPQAARTLNLPTDTVVRHLRDLLDTMCAATDCSVVHAEPRVSTRRSTVDPHAHLIPRQRQRSRSHASV
jgi:DNA-directed RNA polymerase specialized sigma24 family protein